MKLRILSMKKRSRILKSIIVLSLVLLISFMTVVPQISAMSGGDEYVREYTDEFMNTEKELRGVWIASVNNKDFPSKTGLSVNEMKAELDAIVRTCKEANLNAIFFQVRPTADALYESSYFPTSKYLTGKQGDKLKDGFDPLKYIIQIAHENGIELHAWINPYRITNGTEAKPDHDLTQFAESSPAKKFPQYVVKYADGRMYFNPGIPEVQKLITDGAVEIVQKYDVDGIHFDDYFYPDPVNTTVNGKTVQAKFDDEAAYKKYGSKYNSLEEFRRESVNTLIKNVYTEIKKVNPNVRFGVSPFGIWANKSASTPEGSDTSGREAYKSLHCDAKAWIDGGYIDYICPQIYWAFDKKEARFDVLVRWWSAVVDGTGVDLYIGHAAYKLTTDFKSETEIPEQIEFARSYMGVKGSVFYGYKEIAANDYNIKTNLSKIYACELTIPSPASTGKGVIIGRPANETNVSEDNINIMGGSNPAYPVYYNGAKLARTKSGYFSVYVPLQNGKNQIVFTQNNVKTTHTVYKGGKPASAYPKMDSYKVEMLTVDSHSPTLDIIKFPGEKIQVRVQAPSKSTVTAKLGGITVTLTPLTAPPDESVYMTEVYSGSIPLPDTQPRGELIDLGNITFTAVRKNESATATGANVKLINDTVYGTPCEVINDFSNIQTAANTNWWEGYLPASVGMRDVITSFKDGYYLLRFGGYVHFTNVKLLTGKTLADNRITSATMKNTGKTTDITFAVAENVPVNAKCVDGVFTVTIYNTTTNKAVDMELVTNPIFSKLKSEYNAEKKTATYTFNLINADNFYGFELSYENGNIIIRVKNPVRKAEGDKPLTNLTIVVDAGHGGKDPGSLGFLGEKGKNEKDLNLEIALILEKKLVALGANVIMMRSTDETIVLNDRIERLNKMNPDLCISVHHNSMPDTSNNTLTRGLLGLYCDNSGRLLAKSVSSKTAPELNRFERSTRYQVLGMLRNHKFPAAIIEMSFITNASEYEIATNPNTPEKSAEGIAKGVVAWVDNQAKFIK